MFKILNRYVCKVHISSKYSTLTNVYRIRNCVLNDPFRSSYRVAVLNHANQTKSTKVLTDPPNNSQLNTVLVNKYLSNPSEWAPTPSAENNTLLEQYMKLMKIRLTTLVIVTSMAGYAMAPSPFELQTFLACIVGTGLLSGAANSINQFHEVPFDAQMARTKQRVLVCGRITPLHAITFAAAASTTGLAVLHFGVNGLTASLGLANLLLYTSIYTPMKRISILNTWVGSIVGAIPPLMGWAACADSLGPGAWLMAALLYSWQFPHFNALSWNLRSDYSRAGYRMMSVTDPGLCKRVALRHTVAINAMCFCAPMLDVTHWWFTIAVSPFNFYFTYLAYKFYRDASSNSSRKLFRFSLLHLPALMLMFLISKKKWYFSEKDKDSENNNLVD